MAAARRARLLSAPERRLCPTAVHIHRHDGRSPFDNEERSGGNWAVLAGWAWLLLTRLGARLPCSSVTSAKSVLRAHRLNSSAAWNRLCCDHLRGDRS